MQRWLLIGGAVFLLLFGVGLPTAYHLYKQSRPHPVWMPIPINAEAAFGETEDMIHQLTVALSEREKLTRIGQRLGLREKWEMNSDAEVVDEILRRLFVKRGEMDSQMGKLPAIHVGFKGTNRDREDSYALIETIMPDVRRILGIEVQTQR